LKNKSGAAYSCVEECDATVDDMKNYSWFNK